MNLFKKLLKKEQVASSDHSMDFFLNHLKSLGFQPAYILDIGANKAFWSRKFRNVFSDDAITFYLIEPQPFLEDYLATFCKENPGSKYFISGAGRKESTLTLTLWKDTYGSSFLPEKSHDKAQAGKQIDVPVLTVDGLLKNGELSIPDLVKIDVQGFELEVLEGAQGLFGKTEIFILETSLYGFLPHLPLIHEVIGYMTDRGYRFFDIAGSMRRPSDNSLAQLDICFIRTDSSLISDQKW